MSQKVPTDYNNVVASLNVDGAKKAIELYQKAFGAKVEYCMEGEGGKVMHASIIIGSTRLFLADTNPAMGCGTPSVSNFYGYFDDVDATFAQAKKAGLNELWPVQDMFWGDRTGTVKDAFGITWTIATHVRDVSPQEMEEGRKQFAKKAA